MPIEAHAPTTALIIAGGLSTRLGQDKRRLRLWGPTGPTLLEHTVAIAAELCSEVLVVLNDAEEWSHLPARLVPDVFPATGPLGGIASGLAAASYDYALTLSADLPLLSKPLLQALLRRERSYDALIPRRAADDSDEASGPRNRRGLETLHAVYSRRCLAPIEARLAAQQRRIISFLDSVRVVEMPPQEWQTLDPHGYSFLNINTPEQLEQVRRLLGQEPSRRS